MIPDWNTPPVIDVFAKERAQCLQQTRMALDFIGTPEARRMPVPDLERHIKQVLPMSSVPPETWAREDRRRQAVRAAPDGVITVTCPCSCAETFEVSLRGESL